MKIQDFGRFDAPIVLFGGAYSNLDAMQALVAAHPSGPMISTGDAVGYCAQPNETVATLRARGVLSIAGNCERQVSDGAGDCGCGFDGGSACDLLSRGWYPALAAAATDETRSWFAPLPDVALFQQGARRYGVIHGGARVNNRFLWPSTAEADFAREIAALEEMTGPLDGVVAGHCGIAFHRTIGRHHWINPGAIGLPPHDGRALTRYGLLDRGEVTFHRLSYDHASARAAMEQAGLTQGYHATLSTGLWPSEDVLPPDLRR